ncbi:metal ABC transporter substrate-binding protein [Microvirga massiliensis]|uniref:metal ABC transporter substrate-binding protein n=1 Tax=Microvirga massiliensis TaxID=1033741 RepID=UPI00062B7727|nr:metal ABC transporter substrate-binding protein [Microvirga massiliensis]
MSGKRNVVTLLLTTLAAVVALPASAQPSRLKVVATFSILGDFVRKVGGDRIDLVTLVGPNGDAHVYSPTPADGRQLAEANVVITNGLGFEGWISRLVTASGTKARIVDAAARVKTLSSGHVHGHRHGHGQASIDPHAWQDVSNAKIYVANIRDALATADPESRPVFEANAERYLDELDALDAEVRTTIAAIPADRRRIITSHEAFAYFENAYGLDFVSPQGVSTESEASARDVARIIQQIRREKIGAVFVENISDRRLIARIADETGAKIGERLYSDALSEPGGPAPTYIDMIRHNIRAIAQALAS